MSDPREPPRPVVLPPQSTVQAAGQAASDVIRGLEKSPILLALILLNILGIGAGVWVLKDLAQISNTRFSEMAQLTKECFEHLSKPKATNVTDDHAAAVKP